MCVVVNSFKKKMVMIYMLFLFQNKHVLVNDSSKMAKITFLIDHLAVLHSKCFGVECIFEDS